MTQVTPEPSASSPTPTPAPTLAAAGAGATPGASAAPTAPVSPGAGDAHKRAPGRAPRRRKRSRRNTWLFAGLVLLGVVVTAFFAMRATRSFHDFQQDRRRPPHEAVGDIAPWMSIPYVAAVYGVPAEFLFEELGIPAAGNERKPLRILDRQYLIGDDGVIIARVRAAVELYYAGGPTATPAAVDPALGPPPDDGPGGLFDGGPDGGPDGPLDDPLDGGPDATPLAPTPPTAPAATPAPTLAPATGVQP